MTSRGETFRVRYRRTSSVAGHEAEVVATGSHRGQAPATAGEERRKLGRRLNTSQRVSHSTGPTAK